MKRKEYNKSFIFIALMCFQIVTFGFSGMEMETSISKTKQSQTRQQAHSGYSVHLSTSGRYRRDATWTLKSPLKGQWSNQSEWRTEIIMRMRLYNFNFSNFFYSSLNENCHSGRWLNWIKISFMYTNTFFPIPSDLNKCIIPKIHNCLWVRTSCRFWFSASFGWKYEIQFINGN